MPLTDPTALTAVPSLTQDDVSWGWAFGQDATVDDRDLEPQVPVRLRDRSAARAWLEFRLRELLASRRVVVAFSGGRDSSTVLALALQVARREGLPEPVALTLRFAGHPDADESDWQELVVDHVGVPDWEKVEVRDDDADLLGPYAREVLLAAGRPVFPFASVVSGIEAERAAGAYLVTGEFGDASLGAQRLALVNALLSRRGRAAPAVWATALGELAPARLRPARRPDCTPDWLRPAQEERWFAAVRQQTRSTPLRWDHALLSCAADRAWRLGLSTLPMIASAYGAHRCDPLGEPAFLQALARDAGARGFRGRADVIRHVAGDLLPEPLITRRTKASFNTAQVNRLTRDWATGWSGGGVDPARVVPERLHRQWLCERPSALSLGLLQQAWLSEAASLRRTKDHTTRSSAIPDQWRASHS